MPPPISLRPGLASLPGWVNGAKLFHLDARFLTPCGTLVTVDSIRIGLRIHATLDGG